MKDYIKILVCIYDKKSEDFGLIFWSPNVATALRDFRNYLLEIKKKNSFIEFSDYDLIQLGYLFNSNDGTDISIKFKSFDECSSLIDDNSFYENLSHLYVSYLKELKGNDCS